MPLYRRVPKLKGICGGNSGAIPKYVTVNLSQLSAFKGSEEVSIESLKAKNILNISGKQAKLPLKVLGDGELAAPLTIHAETFSSSALKKIKKAGGKIVETPKKIKWTRKIGDQRSADKAAAAPPVNKKSK
jgi:large subunit ribosomal protein L15